MWDDGNSEFEEAGFKIFFLILMIVIVSFFIFLNSFYQDYKMNIINQSKNTIIEEVSIKKIYTFSLYNNYIKDLPEDVILDQKDYSVYEHFFNDVFFKNTKAHYNMILTYNGDYLLNRNGYIYESKNHTKFYKISSTFLDDSMYLCDTKIVDQFCYKISNHFKYTE